VAESLPAKHPECGAATRQLILTASTTVFAIHGYHRTTIEQLLGAAGIDRATFEGFFGDKEDCFLAAFEHHLESARERLLASMPSDAAWPQRLASALAKLFELIEANPAAARLLLVEAPAAGAKSITRYTAALSSVVPFMVQGREQDDREPPPIVDTAIPGGVAYVLGAHIARGGPTPLHSLYAEALHLLATPYLDQAQLQELLSSSPSVERR
jgi:AcrR family transcriptional regulator